MEVKGKGNEKAKESAQVRKYRRKLAAQIEEEKKNVNETALKKVKETILLWISRQPGRIDIKDKTITLFDGNKHPAPSESKYVRELMTDLRRQSSEDESTLRSLKGRISSGEATEA